MHALRKIARIKTSVASIACTESCALPACTLKQAPANGASSVAALLPWWRRTICSRSLINSTSPVEHQSPAFTTIKKLRLLKFHLCLTLNNQGFLGLKWKSSQPQMLTIVDTAFRVPGVELVPQASVPATAYAEYKALRDRVKRDVLGAPEPAIRASTVVTLDGLPYQSGSGIKAHWTNGNACSMRMSGASGCGMSGPSHRPPASTASTSHAARPAVLAS